MKHTIVEANKELRKPKQGLEQGILLAKIEKILERVFVGNVKT